MAVRKASAQCVWYAHQKIWVLDGRDLAWSTGNLSPSDFGEPPEGDLYPPFGQSGWTKTNRDFTVWVKDATAVKAFRSIMDADAKASGVQVWSPNSPVRCGF